MPEKYDAHKQTKCRTDPIDGEKYIHNTISWQILKVVLLMHKL
jgi:hypothetical protein